MNFKRHTKTKPLRIGVDVDGVLYPFDEVFHDYCVQRGHLSKEQIQSTNRMDFFINYGLSLEEFEVICARGVKERHIYLEGSPYSGVQKAVKELRKHGTVHIITHRLWPGSIPVTIDWFSKHNILFDTLTFSEDKTCVETDYMLEDNIDNYDSLDRAGCAVYLLNRTWNQVGDTRRRLHTIEEFVEVVKNDLDNKTQKAD